MTYKDLIFNDGNFYCRECGEELHANMEVRGSLEFNLRIERDEVLVDNSNFQYAYSEPTSDIFYCNECGAEYTGAKNLYDGASKLSKEELELMKNYEVLEE